MTHGHQTAEQPRADLSNVLVVEDNRDVASLLQTALEDENCRVRVAHSGQQALQAILEQPPEALTLDLMLPGDLSGADILRALRQRPETQNIPVVLVSAHAHELDPDLAPSVALVVPKPFYLSQVVDGVLQVLGRTPRSALD